jgi:cytochrome c-type biogenesis protein CcmH/NrfG
VLNTKGEATRATAVSVVGEFQVSQVLRRQGQPGPKAGVRQRAEQLGVADFDEVIRLDPSCSDAWNNRGNVWRSQGEYDTALADYTEAIRLDPSQHYP